MIVHPYGEKSPIENFLKKKPDGGIHHICIEVHGMAVSQRLNQQEVDLYKIGG